MCGQGCRIASEPETSKPIAAAKISHVMNRDTSDRSLMDVTHEAWLDDSHADLLRSQGACGEFVAQLLDHFVGFHQQRFGWPGAPIHDAVTVAHVIDPSLLTTVFTNVTVETRSPLTLGRTVVDIYSVTNEPANCTVGTHIDRDRFVTLLMGELARLNQ